MPNSSNFAFSFCPLLFALSRAACVSGFNRLENDFYLFRPFGGLYRRRELNPPAFHVSPRFTPIPYRFRALVAPTLARLLFGISIPTRHAVKFAALARVVVSDVSAPLIAFVPIFGWWTTCAAFAFFTPLLIASVARFRSVQPRGGCLSWAVFGLGFGCALTCAALPPLLTACRFAFARFYCFQRRRLRFRKTPQNYKKYANKKFWCGYIRDFQRVRGMRYHHTHPFPLFPIKAAIPPSFFIFAWLD